MEEEQDVELKGKMKKTLIVAFAILIGFFVVSKVLSSISNSPAQESYERRCAACHGLEGKGLKDLIPPLAGADWLAHNQENLVCVIRYGIEGEIVVNGKSFNQPMDGLKLSDIELYNIINYINTSWGNDFGLTTTEKVNKDLEKCTNRK